MKLDKKESCIIIVDMQKRFLEKGEPIEIPNGKKIVPNIIDLINYARENSIQLVWTKANIIYFKDKQYERKFPKHFDKNSTLLTKSGGNYEIINELMPYINTKTDIIIEKDRYSSFFNTNLDLILRSINIKNIFVTGVSTNVCVESTIRDAFQLNYNTFLLNDCTATFSDELQKLSEQIIDFVFGDVINLKTLKQKLS